MDSLFVPDQTANKLILLFMLDKMEIPLTENSVLEICTSKNNWLNYMECKDILWQLVKNKFVWYKEDESSPAEGKYSITSEGRDCLSHFYGKIPPSIRETIADFCKKNRISFKRAQEYVPTFHKNSDGTHTVVLRINNPQDVQPLLKIQIKTDSRRGAMNACKRWEEKAPSIYEYILENLLD